jgi:hypothetical protein
MNTRGYSLYGGGAHLRSPVSTRVHSSLGKLINTEYILHKYLTDERKCAVMYGAAAGLVL